MSKLEDHMKTAHARHTMAEEQPWAELIISQKLLLLKSPRMRASGRKKTQKKGHTQSSLWLWWHMESILIKFDVLYSNKSCHRIVAQIWRIWRYDSVTGYPDNSRVPVSSLIETVLFQYPKHPCQREHFAQKSTSLFACQKTGWNNENLASENLVNDTE